MVGKGRGEQEEGEGDREPAEEVMVEAELAAEEQVKRNCRGLGWVHMLFSLSCVMMCCTVCILPTLKECIISFSNLFLPMTLMIITLWIHTSKWSFCVFCHRQGFNSSFTMSWLKPELRKYQIFLFKPLLLGTRITHESLSIDLNILVHSKSYGSGICYCSVLLPWCQVVYYL